MLGRSRNVKILATSRESLMLDGETVFTVPPLALEGGETSDAVTLFVDRARAVRPDFGLGSRDTAAAVTEICETLDGLPLGIELAAARMAAMSAVEVRDRLADRFRLLRGSTPGPERQLTLSDAVAWSYDLLTDDERELLGLTSVFAGGFDLTSVCAVRRRRPTTSTCSGTSTRWSGNRSSSPTTPPPAPGTASSRPSASSPSDRLAETGALEAHPRSARRVLRGASQPRDGTHWNGPGWRDAVDWVEVELGNLRAGYQWSAARGDLEVATDIAAHAALMGFSVQLFETLAWAEELLERATAADVRRLPRLVHRRRLRVLRRKGAGGPRAARTARPSSSSTPATTRASPGTPPFVEALCNVYCGDLDRYVELTGLASPSGTAATAATASRRTSTASSRPAASRRRSRSPRNPLPRRGRSEIPTGSPTRSGSRAWHSRRPTCAARSRRGTRASPSCASSGSSSSKASSRATRRACTPPTASPRRRWCCSPMRSPRSTQAGNVPQLIITLASVPALFERLDRPAPAAMLLGALSRRAVEHPPRPRARRSRRPRRPRAGQDTSRPS